MNEKYFFLNFFVDFMNKKNMFDLICRLYVKFFLSFWRKSRNDKNWLVYGTCGPFSCFPHSIIKSTKQFQADYIVVNNIYNEFQVKKFRSFRMEILQKKNSGKKRIFHIGKCKLSVKSTTGSKLHSTSSKMLTHKLSVSLHGTINIT